MQCARRALISGDFETDIHLKKERKLNDSFLSPFQIHLQVATLSRLVSIMARKSVRNSRSRFGASGRNANNYPLLGRRRRRV